MGADLGERLDDSKKEMAEAYWGMIVPETSRERRLLTEFEIQNYLMAGVETHEYAFLA